MSLGSRQSNQGLRTEQAKRVLVRYIWDLNLQPGDKLPAYEALRRKLGLGSATINRAVCSLEQQGVLETKRRVGTFVVDPEADGHPGWVIGLAALRSGDGGVGPFYSCLLHYLQTSFHELGCKTEVFYQKSSDRDTVDLDCFPGLLRSVTHGKLDSLVLTANLDKTSWGILDKSGMNPYFVGAPTPASRGVFIDFESAINEMIGDLIHRGCRRPALVSPDGSVHGSFFPVFRESTKSLAGFDPEDFHFTGHSIDGGLRICDQICQIRPDERPDGIAIVDDQIAMGLMNKMVRVSNSYSPPFAVMVNKQVQMCFPYDDVEVFEIDIQKLADATVKNAMGLLRGNQPTEDRILLKAEKRV